MKQGTKEGFEAAAAEQPRYQLRLYVSGATPRSTEAIANIRAIADLRLKGRFDLQIVDAFQEPELLRRDDIVALPTLVKKLPPPLRQMVGDLSDEDRVMLTLGLVPDAAKD